MSRRAKMRSRFLTLRSLRLCRKTRPTSLRSTFKQSNGYHPKYDVVTDMKGVTVKPINE